jgi:type I restriction enzyme R subunit
MKPAFFDPLAGILQSGEKLPHWQQGAALQFVTFRLADALPRQKLEIWREERSKWQAHHPGRLTGIQKQEFDERFSERIEEWLDSGAGSCALRAPAARKILADILMRYQGLRVEHHAWVIMPNHVHLLFQPRAAVASLVKAWKGASARAIGTGNFWQKNYRDTLIRDADHYRRVVRYIRNNPAKIPSGDFSLWQSRPALEVE